MLQVQSDVLVSNVVDERALRRELVGTHEEVFQDLGMAEVPLSKQSFHCNVNFVFQQAVDRDFSEDAHCFLHECSRDGVLLGQKIRFNLAVAADAVVQVLATLQDKKHLPVGLEVTAVGQSHGCNFKEGVACDAVAIL